MHTKFTCNAICAQGFKRTDEEILSERWHDGATAATVWVCGNAVHSANIGDARAVLARANIAPTGMLYH